MSRFLSPLEVRFLREWDGGRQKYQLLAPLAYESDVLGDVVVVPPGFVCDGQSIPRVVAAFTGNAVSEAGSVHDWLYAAHVLKQGAIPTDTLRAYAQRLPGALDASILPEIERATGRWVSREESDLVYREILLLFDVHQVDADKQYAALDAYGKAAWAQGPFRLRVVA